MENDNKPIEEMSAEELNNLKIWLFKENVRVLNEKKELEEWREHLLRYCELDTFAMVKVLEKLQKAAK